MQELEKDFGIEHGYWKMESAGETRVVVAGKIKSSFRSTWTGEGARPYEVPCSSIINLVFFQVDTGFEFQVKFQFLGGQGSSR